MDASTQKNMNKYFFLNIKVNINYKCLFESFSVCSKCVILPFSKKQTNWVTKVDVKDPQKAIGALTGPDKKQESIDHVTVYSYLPT